MTYKTSIRGIDPDLLWEAKIYAAQTQLTMGQVVSLALETLLEEESDDDGYDRSVPTTAVKCDPVPN
jgi:hypothetical protein